MRARSRLIALRTNGRMWVLSLLVCGVLAVAGCGRGYRKQNGEWVYVSWSEANGTTTIPVPVPAQTELRELEDPRFAVGDNAVYFMGKSLRGADAASFRHLEGEYWRDSRRVFLLETVVADADPDTFKALDHGWARDRSRVYSSSQVVDGATSIQFVVLQGVWAKDEKAYFCNALGGSFRVPCDYASFTVLSDHYGKDHAHAFWNGRSIEGADAKTFEVLKEGEAKDSTGTYSGGSRRISPGT
jgi:hypothetical protein